MRVALAEIGRRGRMDLTFALQNGRTVLRDAYCEVPFKITRVLNSSEPMPHLILMQTTAGLFGGDNVTTSIRVEAGARVRITQQAATRIHPSQDLPAIQNTHVIVESGAQLQLYMEPLIPFADSWLQQATRIDVEAGGNLSYWEGFMTGRIDRGESWKFREFSSETRLCRAGRLMHLDRFVLSPDEVQPLAYAGTGIRVGDKAAEFAARLHEALPAAGVNTLADDLALVRVVSDRGPAFHRCREAFEVCLAPPCAKRE